MPWKASSVMEERLRFVGRLLDGESMSDVCREFGISRKTGYKIYSRYREHGLHALTDRSRRPVRYANQLPQQVESLIVNLKRDKPHWGARKIRELLVRRLNGVRRLREWMCSADCRHAETRLDAVSHPTTKLRPARSDMASKIDSNYGLAAAGGGVLAPPAPRSEANRG
jgi:transposase